MKPNFHFFLVSFLIPLTFVTLGFFLIAYFVVFSYLDLKFSEIMDEPFIPSVIKTQAGFSAFEFNELTPRETSSSGSRILANARSGMTGEVIPKYFYLSIPKLKIDNATIETNSKNLSPDSMLGHYSQTALPGEKGNVFVYGHSALPIFYNPKDYKTIFSKLPELKIGDTFFLTYDTRIYNYEVIKKIILKPEEVSVYDSNPARIYGEVKTVTLFTCVPPGAKTYRILVIAKQL